MATNAEIFQSYVNKDYPELFALAQNSYATVYGVFKQAIGDSRQATQALLTLVFTSVCSDGQLTDLETKFLNDLAGTSYTRSEMVEVVKGYANNSAYARANELYDSMPQDIKAELLNLCLCVCAIDERISKEEVNFIMHLVD